ncbi:uncharacterized protein [Littorina saxatilis]|uniref:Uncharacterized protein n=1 Tax=Littorina saxatilis TaxID=31220 RepID=A0AAN9GLU4_9CAEN
MARRGAVAVTILGILFSLCGPLEGSSFFDLRLEDLLRKPLEMLGIARARRLSGGTAVTNCDYPGVVAVTFNGRIMCGGIHQGGKVTVPNDCAEFLEFVTRMGPAVVNGDDGTETGEIESVVATNNNDGTSTIPLTSALATTNCASNEYVAYDPSMTIDTGTCEIISYGGLSKKGHTYDGSLQSAPLVDNPMQGCCADVLPNLESYATIGTIEANPDYYTCSKTEQGVCNGDIGAPIYCTDTASGSKVVVGMAATAKCSATGEIFVSIDLTGGSLTGFSS